MTLVLADTDGRLLSAAVCNGFGLCFGWYIILLVYLLRGAHLPTAMLIGWSKWVADELFGGLKGWYPHESIMPQILFGYHTIDIGVHLLAPLLFLQMYADKLTLESAVVGYVCMRAWHVVTSKHHLRWDCDSVRRGDSPWPSSGAIPSSQDLRSAPARGKSPWR